MASKVGRRFVRESVMRFGSACQLALAANLTRLHFAEPKAL